MKIERYDILVEDATYAPDGKWVLYSDLKQVLDVLREQEWEGWQGSWSCCPDCWNNPKQGHTPTCHLGAILKDNP